MKFIKFKYQTQEDPRIKYQIVDLGMHQNIIQFQYKPRRQERPSRYVVQRGLGLSPNTYKNQLSSQLLNQPQHQQLSSRNSVNHRDSSAYYNAVTQQNQYLYVNSNNLNNNTQNRMSSGKNYVKNLIQKRRDQNDVRKQQMMRKVKQLQEKVLPMIQNQRQQNTMNEFGWQNRIQQKVLKLETHVDQMKKQLQLQMQRKLIEIEQKWQIRFQKLQSLAQASINAKNNN